MKLKGVNPIEQHIEKIVLMVMLVLLLAVLAQQFVSRPNDIDVGGRNVSPDQVYTVLESEANRLDGKLKELDPALPEIQSVNLIERYNEAFASSSGGAVRLSAALGEGVDITAIGVKVIDGGGSDGPVNALAVPMTSRPVAVSQWSTLDPYAVIEVPAYEEYIPAAQPFDFASVSVEANFSGTDLESVLMGNGNTEHAIPKRFWSASGIAILGFDAERQKLNADGSWGEAEAVVRPPHTPMPTQAIGEDAGLFELTDLVKKAEGVAEEITHPMFPPTIAGAAWMPPSDRGDMSDDSEAVAIARLERLLKRTAADLERMNAATKKNTKKIERTETRIEELKDELKDLGVDPDDTTGNRTRTSKNDVKSILEEESVALWLHDIGVEPGATYRYRTRVVVNNPLFRKGGELDPDDASQQALTQEAFAKGEWSDWSDYVVVGAKEYFFVTKAETGTRVSGSEPKATLEMYKMYYGQYRRSTFSASPGDELATTVRMSGDLLMFDTGVIEAGEAAKAIEALNGEEPSTKLPDGVSELSNRISIQLGAFVLDIYQGHGEVENDVGQRDAPMQVVLMDADGQVIVRSDLGDKESAAYALASRSASDASESVIRSPGGLVISPAAELFEKKGP